METIKQFIGKFLEERGEKLILKNWIPTHERPGFYKATDEVSLMNRGQKLSNILKEKKKLKWTEKASIIVIEQLMDYIDEIS